MRELTRRLKALANERRLKIIESLMDKDELTVGEISQKLKLSYKSVSKHLLILENAGFLSRRQTSTYVYYSLARPKKGNPAHSLLVVMGYHLNKRPRGYVA